MKAIEGIFRLYYINDVNTVEFLAVVLSFAYFHSHAFSEKFPSVPISDSKTPTILLRNANLSPDDFLKK